MLLWAVHLETAGEAAHFWCTALGEGFVLLVLHVQNAMDHGLRFMAYNMLIRLFFYSFRYELLRNGESWRELNKMKFRDNALSTVLASLCEENASKLPVVCPSLTPAEIFELGDDGNVKASLVFSCGAPPVLV